MAYRAAEGAIEKMTSDLSDTFADTIPAGDRHHSLSSPASARRDRRQIYHLHPDASNQCEWNIAEQHTQIQTGPYQGLSALTVPVTLQATASEPLGQEVSMIRTVEVALIPVFQFGVFSDSDMGFYSSPDLDFNGRVHTNGDLYLGVANSYTLTFHDKLTAYGNVIRHNLPNGLLDTSYNDAGTVLIPTAAQGCDGSQPACRAISSD